MLLFQHKGESVLFENLKDIRYDEDLLLEAYQFNGVAQAFPNHFHEYYVIGLIEAGERHLTVNNQEYRIGPGDLMTFNPMNNHACEQTDGGNLRYRCLNIKQEVMRKTAREVLDCNDLPQFCMPVQYRTELASIFCDLHDSIMTAGPGLEKEEAFLVFMELLLSNHAEFGSNKTLPVERKEIEDVCAFLEQHYPERITLDMLGGIANLNKYSLVRMFTRCKGITPYRYLETVRIGEAKKLLEKGMEPAQVAQQTGFSDQSHFSNYFSQFIGLTPGLYQSIFREEDQ